MMIAADFRFAVAWKDEFELGLTGVVEVNGRELEEERLENHLLREDADVDDLIKVLTKKLRPISKKEGGVRFVESIHLYGRRLTLGRPLKSIIPDAPDGCPRLVAKTHFADKLTDALVVCVKHLTGTKSYVHCWPSDSVATFKHKIQDSCGLLPDQQRLTYRGCQLEDGRQLSYYKITSESVLHLVLRLCGGGGPLPPGQVFADVTHRANLNEHELSSEAPDWRICAEGLNVEGKCRNRECKAFGEMVIFKYGFDSFNLMGDEGVTCPMCYKNFKPITCGFYKCLWKFEGVRSSDGYFISSPWQGAGGSKYHRFDAEEDQGSVEWDSLLIIVKSKHDALAAKVPGSSRSVVVRKDNVCSICWSRFGSTTKRNLTTAQCGHSFHSKCFVKWSEWCGGKDACPSCPLCRKTL